MGICEIKNNGEEQNKANAVSKKDDKYKINETIQTNGTSEINGRVKECGSEISPFEGLDPCVTKASKSVCKISIEMREGNKLVTKYGTGFLLKFDIDQEMFYCLMSNEHVINKNIINNNNNIMTLNYDSGFKSINLKLDEKERYIKSYIEKGLDITVVQIIEKDNINRDYFLFPEKEIKNNNIIYSKIYVLQYPKGEKLDNARGLIKKIEDYEFTHLSNTEQGSSGSPIFLENSINVLGIHKESNQEKTEKYANFIYPVINITEKDMRKKRNNGKYINGRYIWEDGKYYIGEFKNNLPHGRGKKFYMNENNLYEGDFINGQFEGNGKYTYDDGNYYIGQFKNGLRDGKGKKYGKNGKLIFEGDFINDKAEGNGKYIYENDDYYIGQWKNGLRNGKGKQYYANGKIKYEGDWLNDKSEGNGKYYSKNGLYYIGQFKNDFAHGEGKIYYPNGNIMYEGDYINGKREGNGKYFWRDGTYYSGQFKNGLSHGKGIEYYANGKIKYEGDWINDKREGNGKYFDENGECYVGQWKNGLIIKRKIICC